MVAVCTVNALARIGEPFPGFFVWENLFVPAVGEPDWTGVAAGLRYHSWLIAADGAPVASAAELNALLEGRTAGEPVTYLLEKDGEAISPGSPAGAGSRKMCADRPVSSKEIPCPSPSLERPRS